MKLVGYYDFSSFSVISEGVDFDAQLPSLFPPDPTFALDFLMSFRIFMTPHDVLKILLARMQTTQDDTGDQAQSKSARQKK